ncbi:MAG: glycosyltransferase family 4 protein [Planctomycetes bacterium]|nr:glycosyltransferase family 4 protein [Planctomycetota bacterium]
MSAPEKLTILHVDAEKGFSGGEVQVFLLMEGLRARGHRSILAAPPGSQALERAVASGFDVEPVRMSSELDLTAVSRLQKAIRERRPDLVHLHTGRATWLGGLAARLAHVPAITTRRMDRRVKKNWRTRLVYGTLVRRAVAISTPVKQCLLDGGVDPAKVDLVFSAVDPDALRPSYPRELVRANLATGADELVLLVLATLVERKGIDVLLGALAALRARGLDPVLWIAGDGPAREKLEELARALELGERVRFLGRRADAPDLLGACDVFVLPARKEGLGVSALEAMAAGRAVVASRVGGLAEAVLDEESGLLVPPDDVRALADALERVLRDAELRARLAAGGPRRVAQGFLGSQMVEAYEKRYRSVLEESRG